MRRSKQGQRTQAQRARLAEQVARVAVDSGHAGSRDLGSARRKAAAQLGLGAREAAALLPQRRDISAAIATRQRLFQAGTHPDELSALRDIAREAMGFMAQFKPRLAGAVLDGTADAYSRIELHLFADPPEAVATFLLDQKLPFRERTMHLWLGRRERTEMPCYALLVDDAPLDLVVFSGKLRTRQPVDPDDGRALPRASLASLEQYFAASLG